MGLFGKWLDKARDRRLERTFNELDDIVAETARLNEELYRSEETERAFRDAVSKVQDIKDRLGVPFAVTLPQALRVGANLVASARGADGARAVLAGIVQRYDAKATVPSSSMLSTSISKQPQDQRAVARQALDDFAQARRRQGYDPDIVGHGLIAAAMNLMETLTGNKLAGMAMLVEFMRTPPTR